MAKPKEVKLWKFNIGSKDLTPIKGYEKIKKGDHVLFVSSGPFEVTINSNYAGTKQNLFHGTTFTEQNPCAGPIICDLGPLKKHNKKPGQQNPRYFELVQKNPSPGQTGGNPPKIPPG
jgi:hypothetical protein